MHFIPEDVSAGRTVLDRLVRSAGALVAFSAVAPWRRGGGSLNSFGGADDCARGDSPRWFRFRTGVPGKGFRFHPAVPQSRNGTDRMKGLLQNRKLPTIYVITRMS